MSDKVFIFRLLKHLSEILKIVWHHYYKKEKQTKCTENADITEEVEVMEDVVITQGEDTEE